MTRMAEFIAIFYTPWFMRSALSFASPGQDIKSYWQMVKYKEYINIHHPEAEKVDDAIDNILESMKRHQ